MEKVQFGCKKVSYAIITETIAPETGEVTVKYATPKAYPGAMTLEFEPQGGNNSLFADDSEWYSDESNTGYTGKMKMANENETFMTEVFGMKKDETTGMIIENATDVSKPFALLYEATADNGQVRRVFYRVTAKRPKITSETNSEKGKTFYTPEFDITISQARDTGDIKAYAKTSDAIFKNIYTTVPVKGASIL